MPPSCLGLHTAPSESVLRYYKNFSVSGLENSELSGMMLSSNYGIVHLVSDTSRDASGEGRLSITDEPAPEARFTVQDLGNALTACKARLLVLVCRNAESYGASLHFAHRLLNSGGPTVIVIDPGPAPMGPAFDTLYLDIVHDTPLDEVLRHIAPQAYRTAMLAGIGGADVLRISPQAYDLAQKASSAARAAEKALNMLTQRMPPEIHDAAALIPPQKLYDLATISPEERFKKSFPADLAQALL